MFLTLSPFPPLDAGSKDILLYDRYKDFADKLIAEADVICCLDFNALKRIDEMADAVAASPARKVMIDHHLYPEEFCKITMSYPKISSTSELIFRLICRMGTLVISQRKEQNVSIPV